VSSIIPEILYKNQVWPTTCKNRTFCVIAFTRAVFFSCTLYMTLSVYTSYDTSEVK